MLIKLSFYLKYFTYCFIKIRAGLEPYYNRLLQFFKEVEHANILVFSKEIMVPNKMWNYIHILLISYGFRPLLLNRAKWTGDPTSQISMLNLPSVYLKQTNKKKNKKTLLRRRKSTSWSTVEGLGSAWRKMSRWLKSEICHVPEADRVSNHGKCFPAL